MSGDRARIVLTKYGDGEGKVRTTAEHGVHDVPNLRLVLSSLNGFGGVNRTLRECCGLHWRRDPFAILHAEAFQDLRNVPGLVQVDRSSITVPFDVPTQVLLGFAEIYHPVSR